MKHQIRMTFEDLCHNFKDFPHLLEYTLKEWTINVEITLYYEFYRTRVVEVNNLDDVVQYSGNHKDTFKIRENYSSEIYEIEKCIDTEYYIQILERQGYVVSLPRNN